MSHSDLIVLSVLAAIAVVPMLPALVGSIRIPNIHWPAWKTPANPQQHWVNQLIKLLAELEAAGNKPAATLCRKLTWELLGGGKEP